MSALVIFFDKILLAHETLAKLMPIFESIRAQDDFDCSFPISLSTASLSGPFFSSRKRLLRAPAISVSHCLSVSDLVCKVKKKSAESTMNGSLN